MTEGDRPDWREWIGRNPRDRGRGHRGLDRGIAGHARFRRIVPAPTNRRRRAFTGCSPLHRAPMHALGPDGHARTGDFLPPMTLPRRMWAASDVRFLAPDPDRRARPASVADRLGHAEIRRERRTRLRRSRPRDARERHPRGGGTSDDRLSGRGRRIDAGRAGCRRVRFRAPLSSRPGHALPLLRPHLQWSPHPLRPALRHRRRGLSRPRGARAVDGDPAHRSLRASVRRQSPGPLLVPRRLARPLPARNCGRTAARHRGRHRASGRRCSEGAHSPLRGSRPC